MKSYHNDKTSFLKWFLAFYAVWVCISYIVTMRIISLRLVYIIFNINKIFLYYFYIKYLLHFIIFFTFDLMVNIVWNKYI